MSVLKTLQLFDLYLPDTVNWAWRLLRHQQDVEHTIGAVWQTFGPYRTPDFKYYLHPWQAILGIKPQNEYQWTFLRKILNGLESHTGLYAKYLGKQLQKERPDLLHAHFAPVACRYLPFIERWDIPLVVSFYGYDIGKYPNQHPEIRAQYRRMFAVARIVTAVGQHTADAIEALGCPPEKIRILRMPVDLRAFAFSPIDKPAGTLHLMQMATFTEKKGHLDTLEAFRRARSICPGIRLSIGGEWQHAALVEQCRDFIRQHTLGEWVTLTAGVPHAEMPSRLATAHVCIHPSKTASDGDMEGPVVVNMEAHALGRPVIATRHSEIPDVVKDGLTGLLVAENDVQALSEAIIRFYRMENDEYRQFADAARQHVSRHFSPEYCAGILKNVYEEAIVS